MVLMKLYTIGFTQKSARQFFSLLLNHGVQRLIDIRINPHGQLAGFARQEDLPYFLNELAGGCQYLYLPVLAPTRELMSNYRENKDWAGYATRFEALMDERNIPAALDRSIFETVTGCLLCSESIPEHCHRRLVAERLAKVWRSVEIVHL
jgi:uncharacterized protein (DUF488 family)